MPLSNFPSGVSSFGIPQIGAGGYMVSGQALFVDNTNTAAAGDSANNGTKDAPFSTLDYAIGRCNASDGDYIFVMPGHAETTTGIALDVAGVTIVGLGYGRNRPTFTSTTAAADLLAVSAANCSLQNVRLVGAASGVTALMNLSGVDFTGVNIEFAQAATPLVGVTIGAAHRFQLIDCTWIGTANGPDTCVNISTKCHDWQLIRPRALFGQNGLDNEFLKFAVGCTGYLIEEPLLVGLDTLVVNLTSSSAAPPDGLWSGGSVMYSAAVTSIEDGVAAATSKGLAFGRPFWAVDVTNKSGGKIPLVTAS